MPTPRLEHGWDLNVPEARALQEELRHRVVREDRFVKVRRVAGADVSYDRSSSVLFAAVVSLDAETLETIDCVGVRDHARFPYIPGYLSFREAPAVLRAFGKLEQTVDLLICDGHGLAHPRRFGLACHLGVWLDLPTIGCGKSRLVGTHSEPGARRGSHRPLLDEGERIGEVVRTREGTQPIYVSVGHRISLPTARQWILRLTPRFRLPEPIRAAHREVNRLRLGG